MGIFKNIFTWWEGATFGTALNSWANGVQMGEDAYGNRYFQAKKASNGVVRRWVIYKGSNDASRVPAEWHGWLHNTHDAVPENGGAIESLEHSPVNWTGTERAYRPKGAPELGSERSASTGDYNAWSPEN